MQTGREPPVDRVRPSRSGITSLAGNSSSPGSGASAASRRRRWSVWPVASACWA